jgi:HAD superfamily hydrolase (TIGR01459 family)
MPSKSTLRAIPVVPSIAPFAAERLAWFTDIWGVMHNGVRPFAPAVEACQAFSAQGGTVLLLSNAPRPAASVAQQLDRIGVPRDAYDGIVSSGDAARALIAKATGEGQRMAHLGPERDLGIYEGLGTKLVPLASASVVVCTGLFDDETETPDNYAGLLGDFSRKHVAMICANPDLTVERDGKIVFCAGAIAAAYENAGGPVSYAGKPHLPIYDMAFATIAHLRGSAVSPGQVLAIGDGVRTDIAGAAAAGIDAVYIASQVHLADGQPLDAVSLDHIFPGATVRPIAAMTGLVW